MSGVKVPGNVQGTSGDNVRGGMSKGNVRGNVREKCPEESEGNVRWEHPGGECLTPDNR